MRVTARRGRARCGGYRVEATGVPGVAAREACERERATAEEGGALYRAQRGVRARGIEAARRRQQRAQRPLVEADQECGDVAHCSPIFFHSAARLARSVAPEAVRAPGRTLTTRSTAGMSRWCTRKDSRITRRRRVRAPPPPPAPPAHPPPRPGAPRLFRGSLPPQNPAPHRPPS